MPRAESNRLRICQTLRAGVGICWNSRIPAWREIRDERFIGIDALNAAVVYTGVGYRDGDRPAFTCAMSSVYHRTQAGWKLALYQQTQLAG